MRSWLILAEAKEGKYRLQQRFPNIPGRLTPQDLPVAIGEIQNTPATIEAQDHDFFQEQPVKSAKAY